MSSYKEATEYISGIPKFAPKTDLENTRIILRYLGNPHMSYKVVHVAGTNGKGSVSKMISLMLRESGHKVGLFTSPHLVKMNERMNINGVDISDADFTDIYDRVMDAVNDLVSDRSMSDNWSFQHPAYFEFIYVMAALYFKEQGCDYVVYETGLGGRLDATNTVTPEVSVITSIGLDHMQYLGDTLEEIANEKAGIIKPGIPVVYNTGEEIADKVVEDRAAKLKSDTVKISYDHGDSDSELTKLFEASFGKAQPLYQYDNAATAVAAYMLLKGIHDIGEAKEDITSALREFTWPGRCQRLAPNVIIDGAHNEDAAHKIVESVNDICQRESFEKVSLFFAVSSDKDYESIIRILVDGLNIEDVYISEINSDRRLGIQTVMKLFKEYLPAEKSNNVYGSTSLRHHFQLAKSELDEDTLLLAVGSLYMVGELLDDN
ncbi:MAG: bifunctional folylpolyglutamate synthase/dihydrofolate synthase [Eubacterium sp.]|nr:bifunctional folylpolyglutamate synthase/dihydrofolate synthase [Eubacterium sp.]